MAGRRTHSGRLSAAGRYRHLRLDLEGACVSLRSAWKNCQIPATIIPLMKESVENWTPEVTPEEIGEVISVGDNIATVSGLDHAAYGEILLFPSGVKRYGAGFKAGGNRLHPLWRCRGGQRGQHCPPQRQDGGHPGRARPFWAAWWTRWATRLTVRAEIEAADYRPIEMPAPEIIDRQPVNNRWKPACLPSIRCSRSAADSAS